MRWSSDDSRITTAGADGAVYEWRLRDSRREREMVHKGCVYNTVTMTEDSGCIFATGSDGRIRQIDQAHVVKVKILIGRKRGCSYARL